MNKGPGSHDWALGNHQAPTNENNSKKYTRALCLCSRPRHASTPHAGELMRLTVRCDKKVTVPVGQERMKLGLDIQLVTESADR